MPMLRELAEQHPGEPAILNLLGVCLRMAENRRRGRDGPARRPGRMPGPRGGPS